MIRPVVRGGGPACLKQTKKDKRKKGSYPRRATGERRRATKALRLAATGYQVHERMIDFRLFHSRLIRTARRGPGSQTNGVFPKGARRLSEKSPAGHSPTAPSGRHPPGARASRPHAVPWVAAQFPCDAGNRPCCRREPHGPGRSRALAPLPVEPGGGDGKGCAKTCAGGTPALPGGLHPMTP